MNEMLSLDAALARLLAAARPVADTETVSTFHAAGRVLAFDQSSAITVPPLDNSSMDGYAVRASDIESAGDCLRSASAYRPAMSGGRWSPVPARASSPVRRCRPVPTPS
jgi:molybdopterin biosynthesis enzyme